MSDYTSQEVREKVDALYRSDSRRVLASLIRLLGDFNLAKDTRPLRAAR
jgi:RNA polymerase sigma-70 factor (ECF subfamily)